MKFKAPWTEGSFGWIAALVGLIIVIVLKVGNSPVTQDDILGLFALAFLAILL